MAEIQDGDQNGSYIGNFQIISLYNDWIWLVICLNNITGGILILQFQLLQKKSIWRKSKMASKMAPENGISHSNRPNYHYIWVVICLNLGFRGQGIQISLFQLPQKINMARIQDGGQNNA